MTEEASCGHTQIAAPVPHQDKSNAEASAEPCPHAETREMLRETIEENRKTLKRGLLKARVLSSTWSIIILSMLNYSMSMDNTVLYFAWAFYFFWAGEAVWEMLRLSKDTK